MKGKKPPMPPKPFGMAPDAMGGPMPLTGKGKSRRKNVTKGRGKKKGGSQKGAGY